jgi:hypothetical protein
MDKLKGYSALHLEQKDFEISFLEARRWGKKIWNRTPAISCLKRRESIAVRVLAD